MPAATPSSIRRKLLLALLSALVLIGVSASAATWLAVRKEADEIFDYQLQQMALSLRDQTLHAQTGFFGDFDYVIQVWDPSGSLVYFSNQGVVLPQSRTGFQTVALRGADWRVYTMAQEDKTIQVAAPVSLRRDRASAMALRILVPIGASIPLFAILIWLLVTRELRPLEDIARAIRRRKPSSLDPLAESGLPEEVVPMVSELNALLGRLRDAIQTQKRFTADAAHELRTPLAALQLQIELVQRSYLAKDRPEDTREAIDSLRAGALRASRLVEQMLTMARLEPGMEESAAHEAFAPVSLTDVAAAVAAENEGLAEAKGVELRLGRMDLATVNGQPNALRTLVRNLLDNAMRYTPAGGRVELEVRAEGEQVVLQVSDTGPGIPAEDRERVFDRFYRVPGSTAEGSGLGLAIVKQIADAHRAAISLGEADHGGLRATVRFPAINQ
jgi:two-component system OmpR family sensor kinase